jgi:hypothetical protein
VRLFGIDTPPADQLTRSADFPSVRTHDRNRGQEKPAAERSPGKLQVPRKSHTKMDPAKIMAAPIINQEKAGQQSD